MKDIIPAKKQSPILGLAGMGGGVGSNIVAGGAAEEAKYIDEVFSNYLYSGNSTTLSVNSGVDNTRGGMIWFKDRTGTETHMLFDTERGTSNYIQSNSNAIQTGSGSALTSFDNDGYTLAASAYQNNSGRDYLSWNFREQKGFFDIVTWTGNGVDGRQISHDLECVPGFVAIKCTSDTENWACYHRDWTGKVFEFDTTSVGTSGIWKNTLATDTYISVNAQGKVNGNGKTYVGYFFAGGASTAATARSVEFNGGNYMTLAASSDLDFGSGDFTIECWFYVTDVTLHQTFVSDWDNNGYQVEINSRKCQFAWGPNSTAYWSIVGKKEVAAGTWNHLAVVRNGNTFTQYLNGTWDGSFASSTSAATNGVTRIARNAPNNRHVVGKISNVRITKGQAIYTSSFREPTAPLTTTSQGATSSNVKLLCCNSSTNTGSTVTPVTINHAGNPTASTENPFYDPEGFRFGENEDQNLIACGSYIGDNSNFPEINVGWEPQWVMIKRTDSADNWVIWDSMRGLVTDGNDANIYPDLNNSEGSSNYIELTPTGFKFTRQSGMVNNSGSTYFYVVIRRPDGYVGKPAEAGTDVLSMDTGNSSSTIPTFDSGFPVDFGIMRNPGTTDNNNTGARLTGTGGMRTNGANAETDYGSQWAWDSNAGWVANNNYGSSTVSWMWKRHAGFDVVTYRGNATLGSAVPHNMGIAPQMIWVKNRQGSHNWYVGHMGLNGGVDPWHKYIDLNLTSIGGDYTVWNDTAPTATHFTLGHESGYNGNANMIAMLFANIPGISKVGWYAGTGQSLTITTGFSPRFLLLKNISDSDNWRVLDTLRGWGASNDCQIRLSSDSAQGCSEDWGAPTSTGFTLTASTDTAYNRVNNNFIYYAHA